tara:strand:- start:331 stop:882 length:552 start_codon:yes stop_codon:yes gene_type:complete
MSKVKYITPPGIAGYPWLQPGRPDTAFDTEGKYKTNLRMSPEDAEPMMVIINKLRKEEFTAKDNVRLPFEKDEETGDVVFKIQSRYQPGYIDAKGNPIPEASVPLMYSGSTLRCSGLAENYENGANKGISLRLAHVQVIDPVSGSGGSAGDFTPVEGFTVDEHSGVGASSGAADFASDDGYDF